MECCGEKRHTQYCPVCGRQLHRYSPLQELKRYLDARTAAADKSVENHKQRLAALARQGDSRDYWLEEKLRAAERRARRP